MEQNVRVNVEDVGKLVLRLALGGLLLFHGVEKILHGIAGIITRVEGAGLPGFVAYGVYIGEVVAPLLIILGLWARVGALLVMIDLLVAIILARLPAFFTLAQSGGWALESEAFYFLSSFAVLLLGAGRLKVIRSKAPLA